MTDDRPGLREFLTKLYEDVNERPLWYDRMLRPLDPRDAEALLKSHEDRTVGITQVGGWWVFTVFLGIDHNHFGMGRPVLFETMVFPADGGPAFCDDLFQARYCTEPEAILGHCYIVGVMRTARELPPGS